MFNHLILNLLFVSGALNVANTYYGLEAQKQLEVLNPDPSKPQLDSLNNFQNNNGFSIMAKRRTTPELNLPKELPQVLSTDFNLFYKPEAEPVDCWTRRIYKKFR